MVERSEERLYAYVCVQSMWREKQNYEKAAMWNVAYAGDVLLCCCVYNNIISHTIKIKCECVHL